MCYVNWAGQEGFKSLFPSDTQRVLFSIHRGFIALGYNQFSEAQQFFKEAVDAEPTNAVVSHHDWKKKLGSTLLT